MIGMRCALPKMCHGPRVLAIELIVEAQSWAEDMLSLLLLLFLLLPTSLSLASSNDIKLSVITHDF
jgi:hypothetical protein